MEQVEVNAQPWTETYIVPELFHNYFVVGPKCSPIDMEDMVSTQVDIEDDIDIFDIIVDEELENIDYLSAMDIGVYDDDCEEDDIFLKDQKYTYLQATEAIDFMRYYMTDNAFPI